MDDKCSSCSGCLFISFVFIYFLRAFSSDSWDTHSISNCESHVCLINTVYQIGYKNNIRLYNSNCCFSCAMSSFLDSILRLPCFWFQGLQQFSAVILVRSRVPWNSLNLRFRFLGWKFLHSSISFLHSFNFILHDFCGQLQVGFCLILLHPIWYEPYDIMEQDREGNQRSPFSLSFTLVLYISNGFGLRDVPDISDAVNFRWNIDAINQK